jgi:hypothetical protein
VLKILIAELPYKDKAEFSLFQIYFVTHWFSVG